MFGNLKRPASVPNPQLLTGRGSGRRTGVESGTFGVLSFGFAMLESPIPCGLPQLLTETGGSSTFPERAFGAPLRSTSNRVDSWKC